MTQIVTNGGITVRDGDQKGFVQLVAKLFGAGSWFPIFGSLGNGTLDDRGVIIFPDTMVETILTRDAFGGVLTSSITDGTDTWVQTTTRDGSGYPTVYDIWRHQ